ncbi:60S ribosomal protein L6 [Musa troglodytarum]|uniref:60S ribosomal protein L6 n=1 Tax=Musa troglodytarum TaxID=320322 RepID=A0A9E7HGU7_9LILI|nr:60S ribosomal protein L6 [Musa troglodytarum]
MIRSVSYAILLGWPFEGSTVLRISLPLLALAMAPTKKERTASRNPSLVRGIGKFSRSKMYHKRGIWAIKAKHGGSFPRHEPKPASAPPPAVKPPKFYPADDVKTPIPNRRKPKPTKLRYKGFATWSSDLFVSFCYLYRSKSVFAVLLFVLMRFRASITPGTVLILLAGRFMGKRVVFLKQLPSGLLLVTGPFMINGVPLRRVNQAYVIATSTKVDLSGVNVDKFDDKYFTKEKKKTTKKGEGEFFETDKEETKALPQEKKDDQKAVDSQLIKAIEAVEDLKGSPHQVFVHQHLDCPSSLLLPSLDLLVRVCHCRVPHLPAFTQPSFFLFISHKLNRHRGNLCLLLQTEGKLPTRGHCAALLSISHFNIEWPFANYNRRLQINGRAGQSTRFRLISCCRCCLFLLELLEPLHERSIVHKQT